MTIGEAGKIAVLWRGDRQARTDATPANNRFHRVFEALASVGIHAEPAVYAEEMANEVRAQYDYFMVVCGPAEMTRLSLAPRGVLDVFGDDGSLRALAQVQATTADAAAGNLK